MEILSTKRIAHFGHCLKLKTREIINFFKNLSLPWFNVNYMKKSDNLVHWEQGLFYVRKNYLWGHGSLLLLFRGRKITLSLCCSLVAYQTRHYSDFCIIKRLQLFYSPLNGIPAHCRVAPPSPSQLFRERSSVKSARDNPERCSFNFMVTWLQHFRKI